MTHELVCVHKGTIVYTENEGGGSIFTVSLPTDISVYEEKDFLIPHNVLLEEEEVHHAAVLAGEISAQEGEVELPSAPLNKRKVLIIEDDNDVREFLKEEVGQYFEVVAEADGPSGLERARTYDADLIICDVLMPGMTGFEVTRKLKNDFDTSHIPIILLTAMSSAESHLEGVESGADAYITKPFSPKLLLARAFKLIEQREKLREKFSNDPNMVRPAICTSDKDKEFADRLQVVMEQQIGNAQFTIDEFASMMGLGRTVFYRKIRGVTGYSPNEYIRIIRMKKAAELLLEVSIGEDEEDPVLYITDLLIHLSGKQLQKKAAEVIEGEKLDILIGSRPLADLPDDKKKDAVKQNVLNILNEKYGIEEEDFLSAELEIVPAGKARDCGPDRSMIAAYGQDDRVCAYTSLAAMLEMKETPKRTGCCLLVDKEEIGSVGATGMQSRFFENSVAELLDGMGCYSELALRRALRNSSMLSSDVSAGYDPAYAEAFEKKNAAYLGRGIVLNKFTGARGKSGSNDANAEYVARVRRIFDDHDVAFQTAELGKVDFGGGGTIAYIAALYGMEVIDSGVAVLSMHAPWEVTSKADVYEAYKAYKAFLLDA